MDPRRRPSLIILVSGLVCAVLVAAGGWLWERARLGADDFAARAKVEREVRDRFDRMAASLRTMARDQAVAAAKVLPAPPEDRDLRALFTHAAGLVGTGTPELLAVTVYGADGSPLAWAGRPSELARDRIDGPAALFVAPGPLGFRLVATEPVNAPGAQPGARLGIVASERLFSDQGTVGNTSPDSFTIDTSLVEVSLRTRHDDTGPGSRPFSFVVTAPAGDPLVRATVDPAALRQVRQGHRRTVLSLVLAVLALTALLLFGPLLDRRTRGRYLAVTVEGVGLLCLARGLLVLALPPGDYWEPLSPAAYRWAVLGPLSRHPADFLLTALMALGLVGLLAGPMERLRQALHGRRRPALDGRRPSGRFLLVQLSTGALLALAVTGYEMFLAATFRHASVDILYFSFRPWQAARLTMGVGLVCFHAAFGWAVVVTLRAVLAGWMFRRRDAGVGLTLLVCWGLPLAALWWGAWSPVLADVPRGQALLIALILGAAAFLGPRSLVALRHKTQGYRLTVTFLALLAPALAAYPSLVHFDLGTRKWLLEGLYGPEVLNQRDNLRMRLETAQSEVDRREAALEGYVSLPTPTADTDVRPDSAFEMWKDTALDRYRMSSAIELYNKAGMLVSRFALNLPEMTTHKNWQEANCTWQTFGEISPFGAHERQLLHAGRNVCTADGVVGTIVINVILDSRTLSFISSQNPYLEMLRGGNDRPREESPGRDVALVYYGWSRMPLDVAGPGAWPIDNALFARITASRTPFWTRLAAGDAMYDVFIENDRSGIYALGFPLTPPIGHFINLAELAVLVALTYVGILAGGAVFRILGLRHARSGPALLQEIRQSFYRKVFVMFVAASVLPVVTLALVTRAFISDRLSREVELAAHKTTVIARQIIEDYTVIARQNLEGTSLRAPGVGEALVTDDAMVALSRVIGQDVNVFVGARLQATSERDLFASGLLPTWTPAAAYRAIVLDRMPTQISQEQIGSFRYMVAAAPVMAAGREAVLTLPLTLRQQEIAREIEDLNRRIILAALAFILVGAGIGYTMAERIADPVSRLTQATRRIAKGDFDARIAATWSDEWRRLMEAFNRMSAELQRQRAALERTHRLEAWAEMARQVAHEIKNPLTPIQLSAEHLRRVHADRGKPLSPVLEGCVDSILSQVRLLRQIATEFSSFASVPTARLAPTRLPELVDEVVRPYAAGAGENLAFHVDVPESLSTLVIDRTLIGRALTNVIDNALHAMPGGGSLTVTATQPAPAAIRLTVADTGVGMDDEALTHLFEPYFSTKAVGTGLGLAIARRNVELNGGTIAVTSRRGEGTVVTIDLPVASQRG